MPLKDWLKRGEKRPKQKKRIRPMSKKRERENREYLKRRKAFLLAHPFCQIWLRRNGYTEADAFEHDGLIPIDWDNGAGVVGHNSVPHSEEIHHAWGRIGKNFLDESTWVACSRQEHTWLHSHPKEARQLGLLA